MKSPIDYMTPSSYDGINKEILALIKDQHREHGTRLFGLGNLNKMKQLNDGGVVLADMISSDAYLKDKSIRLWTGDTLTAASVLQQVLDVLAGKGVEGLWGRGGAAAGEGVEESPMVTDRIFYIGANGKIGNAVCKKLVQRGIKVTIFSKYVGFEHPLVNYTQNLNDILDFSVCLVGKHLKPSLYRKALSNLTTKNILLLDYTVPFSHLGPRSVSSRVKHVQIGVLKVTNNDFLRGYYDVCMGLPQGQIYPCHAGCILSTVMQKETNEVGEIDTADMEKMWQEANKSGLFNRDLIVA